MDQSGTFQGFVDMSYTGSYHSFRVSLDTAAPSVRFDEFQLTTNKISLSREQTVTVGFGQSKKFTIAIDFEPTVFWWGELNKRHALSVGAGGAFNVGDRYSQLSDFSNSGGVIKGKYKIVGPTQVIEKYFSLPAVLGNNAGGTVADAIGASDYPTSVSVLSSGASQTWYAAHFFPAGGPRFINEVVDGVSITTGIERIYLSGYTGKWPDSFSGSLGAKLPLKRGSLKIDQHPKAQEVKTGQPLRLECAVTGSGPLTYQWRKNGVEIGGATQPAYELSAVSAATAGSYSVTVSNAVGQVESLPAQVNVLSSPVITAGPVATTVNAGSTASFSVTATGYPLPNYKWRKDGIEITGNPTATTSTLKLDSVGADSSGSYDVVVANSEGVVTSVAAVLEVRFPPTIAGLAETRRVVQAGSSITFSASVTGATSLQWYRNGRALAGATDASLVITNANLSLDAGWYQLAATNSQGTTKSKVLFVVVSGPTQVVLQDDDLRSRLFPANAPHVTVLSLQDVGTF